MKFIKGLLKVIASGIVAMAIICGLLCFYDIKPIHKENPKGNTDFVWLPNSIWVKATEGIAFGKFDANGFNNKSVISNPDIIVLGSSHMEVTRIIRLFRITIFETGILLALLEMTVSIIVPVQICLWDFFLVFFC